MEAFSCFSPYFSRVTRFCSLCGNSCGKLFCRKSQSKKNDAVDDGFGSSSNEIMMEGDNDSVDDEGEEYSYPTRLTSTLEQYIDSWQNAITHYRIYEEYCLEEKYNSVFPHIQRARTDPDGILGTPGVPSELYELARLRKQIFDAKDLLGLYENSVCDKVIRPKTSKKGVWSVRNPMQMSGSNLTSIDRSSSTASSSITENKSNQYHSSHLSVKWAQRLGDIVSTQGEMNISVSGLSMKLKPKWPDFLTSVTYPVIKRNRFGQRMHRLIRFTEYHLLNVKNGSIISKVYLFSQIRRITLEDNETMAITLKSGKNLTFISNLAPTITQQLITRIKVRQQLDRIDVSEMASSILDYSPALAASIIQNISMETQSSSDALSEFSHELLDRTIRSYIVSFNGKHSRQFTAKKPQISTSQNDGDDVTSSAAPIPLAEELISVMVSDVLNDIITRIEGDSLEPLLSVADDSSNTSSESSTPVTKESSAIPKPDGSLNVLSSPPSPSKPGIESSSSSMRNVFAISEGSAEHSVKSEIQKIIFDPDTPEGNTKIIFLEKFMQSSPDSHADSKSRLQSVRLFIDGMHGHILKNKGRELAEILLAGEGKKISFVKVLNHPLSGEPSVKPKAVRPSIYEQNVLEELTTLDREVLSTLSLLIFTVVEEATFLPLRDEIVSLLPSFAKSVSSFCRCRVHSSVTSAYLYRSRKMSYR
jgi:hypothetical protein